MNEKVFIQPQLFTQIGAFSSFESKFRKRDNTRFIPATLWFKASSVKRFLSSDFPEGSPIIPVAPPTSAIGLCPKFFRCTNKMIGTKLPICKESEVGSNPI